MRGVDYIIFIVNQTFSFKINNVRLVWVNNLVIAEEIVKCLNCAGLDNIHFTKMKNF
jgi:hypothetical protein